MEQLINAIIGNLASYIVGALFAYLSWQIKHIQAKAQEESNTRELQVKVDLWLLRGELIRNLKYHIDIGYIPADALAVINEGYELYKKMGGNGEVSIYMEQAKGLPHHKE